MGSRNYNTEWSVSDISLWSSVLILIIDSMQQWWGIFHKEMFRQKQIYHSSIIHPLMQYRPFDRTAFSTFRLSSDCFDPPHKKKLHDKIVWWTIWGCVDQYLIVAGVEKDFCVVSAMNESLVLTSAWWKESWFEKAGVFKSVRCSIQMTRKEEENNHITQTLW